MGVILTSGLKYWRNGSRASIECSSSWARLLTRKADLSKRPLRFAKRRNADRLQDAGPGAIFVQDEDVLRVLDLLAHRPVGDSENDDLLGPQDLEERIIEPPRVKIVVVGRDGGDEPSAGKSSFSCAARYSTSVFMLAAFQQKPTSSLTGRTSCAARGINVNVMMRKIKNGPHGIPPVEARPQANIPKL